MREDLKKALQAQVEEEMSPLVEAVSKASTMQEHPVNEMLLNSNRLLQERVLTTSIELNSGSRRLLQPVYSSNRCIPTICTQFKIEVMRRTLRLIKTLCSTRMFTL